MNPILKSNQNQCVQEQCGLAGGLSRPATEEQKSENPNGIPSLSPAVAESARLPLADGFYPAGVNGRDVIAATATQPLTGLYERKLAALEALKKSLLHQAFTGAL